MKPLKVCTLYCIFTYLYGSWSNLLFWYEIWIHEVIKLKILNVTFKEHLVWQRDPIMNPGPFTRILNRGRETTDYEWTMFSRILCTTLLFWYFMYLILSRIVNHYSPKVSRRTLISLSFLRVFIEIHHSLSLLNTQF